jgi:predicted HTH transcriptional regulator
MDKHTLLQRLTDIEWDDFEVKKSFTELPQSIWETVGAFSNTSGGWVVLGVSQQGKTFEITGVSNPEKMEQDFVTTLRSHTKFNVLINPECKKYNIDGKTVLAFYITSSEQKPVYFNSLHNTFIRTASGDQRATDYEINALLREQSFGTMSAKPVEGTTVESLHQASYSGFRDYLRRMIPDLPYNMLDDNLFNQKLQIVKDGKLTYGGLLFLGDNMEILNHFPDFRVDYLEIPAKSYADAYPRYTFRMQEQENLWQYYFALFQRLRIYANNPLYIGEMGGGYEDNKQLDALREGLINMLIHCDYFSPMKPRIRVFTNRIEFENPGTLPRPIDELMKEDVSVPRNPVLAKLFRIAKFCENAGYGFDKMLIWKKETNNQVLFETFIDKTKITFILPEELQEEQPENAPENAQKTHRKTTRKRTDKHTDNQQNSNEKGINKPEKNAQKTIKKRTENNQKMHRKRTDNQQNSNEKQPENAQKTHRKTTRKRTDKQIENTQKILDLLKENLLISRSQIAVQLNLTASQVIYYLRVMKKNKLINREGTNKIGKWIIMKNDMKDDMKITEKQPENNQKTTRKRTEKQPEMIGRILELLISNATISRSEIANQLEISEGSLRHYLGKMKIENLIRREGADRGGKWIVINQTNQSSDK